MIGSKNLKDIFSALDRQIGVQNGSSIGLVVCGGTALAALGLIQRTTKDVDILAQAEETAQGLSIHSVEEFPSGLTAAAKTVARDFGLPEQWLNLGPASQVASGLPDGFESRLVKRSYGEHLTIYFTGRTDQIYFKLYAAIDRDDYHVQDLFALKPADAELEKAAQWVLTQDVSKAFRLILIDFLERHGYGAIAERI
jgi:hypothetical protein